MVTANQSASASPEHPSDEFWMREALGFAATAGQLGEVPIGALIVHEGRLLVGSPNAKERFANPCAHAEILVIQAAAKALSRWRLSDCTLYTTLEPCVMCAGACVQARMGRVVFGAWDPKFGGIESLFGIVTDPRSNHRCRVSGGVLRDESAALLQDFFRSRRQPQMPDGG